MAIAHPGLNSLTRYLKTGFPWKEDWECDSTKETFTYEEVRSALFKLKEEYPDLYKLLGYRWLSNRSRNDIADKQHIDASTLKRSWDRIMNVLKIYLSHPSLLEDL